MSVKVDTLIGEMLEHAAVIEIFDGGTAHNAFAYSDKRAGRVLHAGVNSALGLMFVTYAEANPPIKELAPHMRVLIGMYRDVAKLLRS